MDEPKLKGKYAAIVVCWLLGCAGLFPWNSMLTIVDYYNGLFLKYHPARVLTLVYQPFAFGTLAILTYYEEKISTRQQNLFGYTLFFISALTVLTLDLATSGKGGIGAFIGVCVVSGAFGIAEANTQGGMAGDLSYMQPEFVQSFLAGAAASGCLTSALRLIIKASFENSKDGLRKGAILFFSISTIFELLCVFVSFSMHFSSLNYQLSSTIVQKLHQKDPNIKEYWSAKEISNCCWKTSIMHLICS